MLQTHRMLSKRIHISLNRYKLKTLLSAIGHFRVCEWKYPTFSKLVFNRVEKRRLQPGVPVTRYAIYVTSCDIWCQRQPLPPRCSVCFHLAVSPCKSFRVQNSSAFSLLFAAFYLQHCAFRYITWVALVCTPICPQGRAHTCTGWLFLFAVLMAAGLLFTMVFFVSLSFLNPLT